MKTTFLDLNDDKWELTGRELILNQKGKRSVDNLDGIFDYEYVPLYDYAFVIENDNITDKQIIRICKETHCTVLYNTEDKHFYLSGVAAGLDWLQDVAFSQLIANSTSDDKLNGNIDIEVLQELNLESNYSITREQYKLLLEAIRKQIPVKLYRLKLMYGDVKTLIEKYKEKEEILPTQ